MVLPGRLTRFTPTFKPLTNVTPFTYRDAYTVQKQIAAIKKYLSEQLTTDFDDKIGQVFNQTEQAVTELAANVQATVEEWATLYETFMSDVNASLMALNDHAVSDLVNDETSLLGQAMRELFADKQGFKDLSDQIELDRDALRQDNQDFKNSVDNTIQQEVSKVDDRLTAFTVDYDSRLEQMRNDILGTLGGFTGSLSGRLGAGRAVIVMIGSSTTTRHEYPSEIARQFHGQYQPGVIRTLYANSWGGENSGLENARLSPGVHIINAGWGGSAGADYVKDSMAADISALNPLIVMHAIGANDWYHGRNPANLTNQINNVIRNIHSNGPVWHVLVHQHERVNTPVSVPYEWDDYLEALHNVAESQDNVVVIDAAQPLREMGVGRGLGDPYHLMADGSHLNTEGHKLLGEVVARKMGLINIVGATDTGWKRVTHDSEHVRLQPQGESSVNEPLMYRVVGDATGYTTYIKGINTRNASAGERVSFAEIGYMWRNALIPKTAFVLDRHRIGEWKTVSSGSAANGPIYLRSSGAIHAMNNANNMGSVGFFTDIVIRA